MNRFYIYHGCSVIFGAIFTFNAATTMIYGDVSVPIIFVGIGGVSSTGCIIVYGSHRFAVGVRYRRRGVLGCRGGHSWDLTWTCDPFV